MWAVRFRAEFAPISTNDTIRRWIHERLLNQRNSPPGITSPEYPSRKLRRRSCLQGELVATTIRKAETDRWWTHRSYVANELFNKSHYEADYKSHCERITRAITKRITRAITSWLQEPLQADYKNYYKLITRAVTSWLQEPLHNSKMLKYD